MKCLIYSFVITSILFSCKNSDDHDLKQVQLESSNEEYFNGEEYDLRESFFTVPSPSEQFDLFQMLGGEIRPELVHDIKMGSSYFSKDKQCLVLGVYLADAAYMMQFEKGKRVLLDYMKLVDKLSNEVGINVFLNDQLMEDIDAASDDPDRLIQIISKNYLGIYDQMLDNDKEVELLLILTGAWIEISYILFESAEGFGLNKLMEELIVDQRYVLDNLVELYQNQKTSESLSWMYKDLKLIQALYNDLICDERDIDIKKRDGDIVLFGGVSCVFKASTYNEMERIVKELRSEIIKN